MTKTVIILPCGHKRTAYKKLGKYKSELKCKVKGCHFIPLTYEEGRAKTNELSSRLNCPDCKFLGGKLMAWSLCNRHKLSGLRFRPKIIQINKTAEVAIPFDFYLEKSAVLQVSKDIVEITLHFLPIKSKRPNTIKYR